MTAPRWTNALVAPVLRSPIHGLMSRSLMLMTVRGRRTGTEHTFPVGYVADDDGWLVIVGDFETKTWWRNLEGGAPLRLTIRRRRIDATAEVLRPDPDPEGFERGLARYLVAFPRTAKTLGVAMRDGAPDPSALREASSRVLLVRLRPAG